MDYAEVLEIAANYWGPLIGEYSDWNPVKDRPRLFPEDIDRDDVCQFKNFRVA